MLWKLAIGCLALMVVSPAAPAEEESPEYRAAYKKGRAEADEALKAGKPVLFTYGLRMSFDNLDRETGVPIVPIAGCVVDDAICGRAAGNNERIAEFVKKSGPPPGSFKKWEKELFDLRGYAKAHEKAARKLALGGPRVESPDGKFAVAARLDEQKLPDGKVYRSVELALAPKDGEPRIVNAPLKADQPIDLFWGPEGSGFLVVRQGKAEKADFQAIDARTGRMLRWEYDVQQISSEDLR